MFPVNVGTIQFVLFAKIPNLAGKCASRRFTLGEFGELLAAGAAANRYDCLDVRILALQLSNCSEAPLNSIDFFIVIGPFIKCLKSIMLAIAIQGLYLTGLRTRRVPSSLTPTKA